MLRGSLRRVRDAPAAKGERTPHPIHFRSGYSRSCQTQHYLVLARFWCNQAESGGAIVKKPRQLIECQRVPTPSLTKTDSTVLISLKTWDFLVPGDSDLHQKRARTK